MSKQPSKTPHVSLGEKYARDVIAGKIEASKWVRLACERHFKDKARKDWVYKFEAKQAERVARFCELFPHTKGKWAARSEPFELQPWQCFVVLSIFGWIHKSGPKKGKRRFTRAVLLVPRKNGKSDLAARIGLYMFAADGEFGAEVYSGATSEDQAWEVFRPARLMAERTKAFQEHFGVGVMRSNLHIVQNGSRFEPVIGRPGDGASPSCAIIDEYHEHLDDSLFDSMETGMAAREQPLTLIITTAGDNLAGPCYAMKLDLEKILEGTTKNEKFWGIQFSVDVEDDWTQTAALKKANPNWGISVDPEAIEHQRDEAIRNSRKQGTFVTKHGNRWVGAREAFFNMHAWHLCTVPDLRIEDCKGCRLFVGLDLASTRDLAAVPRLFELEDGYFALFGKFYCPEFALANGANQNYQGWARDGFLTVTDGNMIDYRQIEDELFQLHRDYGITELAFDPAYAQRTVQGLMAEGIPCVEVRPTVLNFSAAMKHLDGLMLSEKIKHPDDPCFTWQISNVVSKNDVKDNVFPAKERAEAKIDGAVATIMAMSRILANEFEPPAQVSAVWI